MHSSARALAFSEAERGQGYKRIFPKIYRFRRVGDIVYWRAHLKMTLWLLWNDRRESASMPFFKNWSRDFGVSIGVPATNKKIDAIFLVARTD